MVKPGAINAEVFHRRSEPVNHSFSYKMIMFCLDTKAINILDKLEPLAGRKTAGLLRVHSKNYLLPGKNSIAGKLAELYKKWNWGIPSPQMLVITTPNFIWWGFNPVNFYIGKNNEGAFCEILLEINNTFGEKHLYRLCADKARQGKGGLSWTFPKKFHVSPFNKVEGYYELRYWEEGNKFQIDIDLLKGGSIFFSSFIKGESVPFTKQVVLKILLLNMPAVFLTTSRIGWQAFKLYFGKKLSVFDKPFPISPITQQFGKPVLLQRILTGEYLERIRKYAEKKTKHRSKA